MKKAFHIFKQLQSKILLILIVVSLLMTSSTFAYWANYVEGSEHTESTFISIGEYGLVTSNPLFLLSSEYATGEYNIINADYFSKSYGLTHTFNETFEIEWIVDSSWLEDYHIEGDVEIDYEVKLLKSNGKSVNTRKYNRLIDYVSIELDEDNPQTIILNDDPIEFGFTVDVEEPENTNHYAQLKDLTVVIVFSYEIDGITYEYIHN